LFESPYVFLSTPSYFSPPPLPLSTLPLSTLSLSFQAVQKSTLCIDIHTRNEYYGSFAISPAVCSKNR
jgi:hypothetical protein